MSSRRALVVRYQRFEDAHVRREALALRDAGYDVEVICTATAEWQGTREWNGVTVRNVSVAKTRGALAQYAIEYTWWFVVCAWLMTLACLRGRRHHVIQITTLPDQQVFAALVPKLFGSRVVVFFKEPTAELVEAKLEGRAATVLAAWSRLVARAAARFADQAIAVTEAHRATYVALGVAPDRVGVVGNCPMEDHVAVAAPAPIDSDRFVVMCHGTVERRMGQLHLVEAFDLARRQRDDLLLVLCGAGSDSDAVRARIEQLDLGEHVDDRGFVSADEIAALMARADLGVVPMVPSPYSRLVHTTKMFEFMYRGVPVVAGDLDATVADFPDACHYYAAGDPDALAQAVVELAADPCSRDELVAAGAAALVSASWAAQRDHYASLVTGQDLNADGLAASMALAATRDEVSR